jgi:hypothetical protein
MGLIPYWSFLQPLDITCFAENKMVLPTGTNGKKSTTWVKVLDAARGMETILPSLAARDVSL